MVSFFSERRGAPQHAAPEVLRPPSSYTNKVDLWSASCVAHAFLTGRSLHRGSRQQVPQQVAKGEVHFSLTLGLALGAQNFVQSLFSLIQRKGQALRRPCGALG
jgi:hypothetical protein